MAFTLLLLAILLFGLVIMVIGAVLLFRQKNKPAGWIVFGTGALFTLISILGFLSLVIVSRTMG